MPNGFQYISLFNKYFNQGCLTRTDKIISLISSNYPYKANSEQIKKAWNHNPEHATNSFTFNSKVDPYQGKNKGVERISEFLSKNLSNNLYGAILHGSLATEEEVSYSDFDGLLVLKNDVYQNKERITEVAQKISHAYSLMISIDPLQHHGWFILNERDLTNWPISFFPPELFNYSKSLLKTSQTFSIKYSDDSLGLLRNLNKLINSIEKSLINRPFPSNLYQLKSLLSEFMLLPTLYIQAKTGKGIYKKFSFTLASEYFSQEDWSIMNEVSELRSLWPDKTSNFIINEPQLVTPSIKKQQIKKSLPIPKELSLLLTPEFKKRMYNLAQLFKITK